MSARGFRPLVMIAGVASAALGCYMVSLKVATERAALEKVERQIIMAQADIRSLNTEIGTRGRLAQLERWNARVIQLSAPQEDQFVNSGFQLAALVAPERVAPVDAPVVLASAPVAAPPVAAPASPAAPATAMPAPGSNPAELMHVAGYTKPAAPTRQPAPVLAAPAAKDAAVASAPAGKAASAKTAPVAVKPVAATAKAVAQKPQPKAAASKPAKSATHDPLAPLPNASAKAKGGTKVAAQSAARPNASKDPGSRR